MAAPTHASEAAREWQPSSKEKIMIGNIFCQMVKHCPAWLNLTLKR